MHSVDINVSFLLSFQVEPEELCHVCSVYTGRETYPCRICYKVYHESCLRKLGQCNDPASSVLLKRALKSTGWSCQNCVRHPCPSPKLTPCTSKYHMLQNRKIYHSCIHEINDQRIDIDYIYLIFITLYDFVFYIRNLL